ncbi:MAG: sulfatase-like hydrolase/transferase [Anaerolineae bacterium]
MSAQRPNILLIHSDQHRYDCLGSNGHPLLKTPNIDSLAAEGIRFTHAFSPSPICVPERNCLLHGQWATEHQCITNYDSESPRPPRESLPTFSHALREGGYYLGYVGKWHVRQDRGPLDSQFGFTEFIADGNPYTAWRESQGLAPVPHSNGWLGELDPHILPRQSQLAWGSDHAIEIIQRGAESGMPFFVRWDPTEPHLPNVVPEPYYSMYPPCDIPPWPGFADTLIGKPYIQAQQRRTWRVDHWTWENWSRIVSRYLAVISLLDTQVGRLLDALKRLQVADNTLVIYTTDHGDLCGSHGMIDKMNIMYDDVVRVPLVMRWPDHIAPGSTCDAFVSHSIDLASTFCDIADVAIPDTFRGKSLIPLMLGNQDNNRQDIFSTFHGNQFGLYSQRMVRDRQMKYIWNLTAEDELYDLVQDPGELRNLATDPNYLGELQRLRRRMIAWLEDTTDPLMNQWTRPQLLEDLKI